MTFQEFQNFAIKTPVAMRSNRDRVDLAIVGLQKDAGKIGSLLQAAFASGKLQLTPDQGAEVQDRMSDVLWYIALLSIEVGINMEDLAARSVTLLRDRMKSFDPDRR